MSTSRSTGNNEQPAPSTGSPATPSSFLINSIFTTKYDREGIAPRYLPMFNKLYQLIQNGEYTKIENILALHSEYANQSAQFDTAEYEAYDLAIMSANVLKNDVIEFEYEEDGFKYRVVGSNHIEQSGLIPWEQLPSDFPKTGKGVLAIKEKWLPLIFEMLLNAGHIDNEPVVKTILDLMREKLCEHIDNADEAKAKSLVKIMPEMLLGCAAKVKHRQTGQTYIDITPLQLAYSEGDPEMCAMFKKYFAKACGSEEAGIAEMQRQIDQKKLGTESDVGSSAQMEEEANEASARKDSLAAIMQSLIQVITQEPFGNGHRGDDGKYALSEATLNAIARFREQFAALQPKIIERGKRFHLETLQEIYEAYAEAARQWKYDYKKCALFEDAAIAFTLGYAPSNDAQRFSQGLYYQQDKKETFTRSSALRFGGKFYEVSRGRSFDFNLSGSNVDLVWSLGGLRAWEFQEGGLRSGIHIAKLISSKNISSMQIYTTSASARPSRR